MTATARKCFGGQKKCRILHKLNDIASGRAKGTEIFIFVKSLITTKYECLPPFSRAFGARKFLHFDIKKHEYIALTKKTNCLSLSIIWGVGGTCSCPHFSYAYEGLPFLVKGALFLGRGAREAWPDGWSSWPERGTITRQGAPFLARGAPFLGRGAVSSQRGAVTGEGRRHWPGGAVTEQGEPFLARRAPFLAGGGAVLGQRGAVHG